MNDVLSHALVTAPNSAPDRWMFFLHGILGSASNWRTFARRVVAADPRWGAVLVDLRLHGDSQPDEARGYLAPPHTLASAAHDLDALATKVPGPIRGILGHSFGGKVALVYAREHLADLEHVFVIDSTPGARPDARGSESTREIVDLLSNLPPEFENREAFLAWVEERGVSRPTAMWLAMNVRPLPNTTRYTFRIDIAAVQALLDDYFVTDTWDVFDSSDRRSKIHLVAGEKSEVVNAADRDRAKRSRDTTLDVIAGAGHWVHADAPDALFECVRDHLAGS